MNPHQYRDLSLVFQLLAMAGREFAAMLFWYGGGGSGSGSGSGSDGRGGNVTLGKQRLHRQRCGKKRDGGLWLGKTTTWSGFPLSM